jgi:hypothetical protein
MPNLAVRAVACVVALVALVGCGESSHGNTDDEAGGKGGSGGSGGGSGTPSAAGLTLNLLPPITSEVPGSEGRSCPVGGTGAFTYAIGMPKPLGTVSNGTQGVGVFCRVTGSGAVSADLSGPDATSRQKIQFTVTSAITDVREPTPADVSFYAPDTLNLVVLDGFPACTLDPITILKAGAILADVTCPLLGSVTDSSMACRAEGTLAFEYCSTE